MARHSRYLPWRNPLHVGLALWSAAWVPNGAQARSVSYPELESRALKSAIELELAAKSEAIAGVEVWRERAAWYPSIAAAYHSEYYLDLQDSRSPFNSVGGNIFKSGDQIANTLSLSLRHPVWDYGITGKRVDVALGRLESAGWNRKREARALRERVLDLYTRCILATFDRATADSALDIRKRIYANRVRLVEAGKVPKFGKHEEAESLAQALLERDMKSTLLAKLLDSLSMVTHERLPADSIELEPLPDQAEHPAPGLSMAPDPEKDPEVRIFALEAEQKKAELAIRRRQFLPKFEFYSRYSLYGKSDDDFKASVSDLEQRDFTTGFSVTMPIFEGFRVPLDTKRARLESEQAGLRSRLARERARIRWTTDSAESDAARARVLALDGMRVEREAKLRMIERLAEEKLFDDTERLRLGMEALNLRNEARKAHIQFNASCLRLNLNEGT